MIGRIVMTSPVRGTRSAVVARTGVIRTVSAPVRAVGPAGAAAKVGHIKNLPPVRGLPSAAPVRLGRIYSVGRVIFLAPLQMPLPALARFAAFAPRIAGNTLRAIGIVREQPVASASIVELGRMTSEAVKR